MQDSRLIQIKEMAQFCQGAEGMALQSGAVEIRQLAQALIDDRIGSPQARAEIEVLRIEKLASALERATGYPAAIRSLAADIVKAADTAYAQSQCGAGSCTGSVCALSEGHGGAHRSQYNHDWTDESDEKYARAIAASMNGRRD